MANTLQDGLCEFFPASIAHKLAAHASVECRAAKEVLFQEGRHFDSLLFIATGLVALDMHVPLKGPIRLLTVGPGEMLAWSAILGDQRMTATATVLEDAELIRILAQPLKELCDADHEVGYALTQFLARSLSRRLLATRLQLLDLFATMSPT